MPEATPKREAVRERMFEITYGVESVLAGFGSGFTRAMWEVDVPGCCVGRIPGLWERWRARAQWAWLGLWSSNGAAFRQALESSGHLVKYTNRVHANPVSG